MRRLRGFGDTSFAFQGDAAGGGAAAPLPEALFSLDVQGERERQWRVQHFEVTEALSALYSAVIDVASESFTDNPDLLLGRYAVLQVQRDPVQRRFYGVVRRVEQRGTTGSSRLARVTLAPSLYALTQRSDARVFQDMTAVEVAQAVLQAAGLYAGMVQIALQRAPAKREYIVQHRETDLAFFARLLESEGITYFFRHDLDGAEALVLTDHFAHAQPVPTMDGGPVPIAGPEMITHRVEAVRNLTWHRELRPAQVTVREFDFTRPSLALEAAAPRHTAEARTLYEPSPALAIGGFEGGTYTLDDAREQAQLRAEMESGPGAVGGGEGVVSGMAPGRCFAVSLAGGHVPDQRYLVTQVTHHGDAQEELLLASEREAMADQRYRNTFACALLDAPYRPARATPRPIIAGLQTATVTGPAGEEVYTDAFGRVRAQFHWDRQGRRDERSSCWLRTVQGPWAGGGWGFQFLPRVGMEVAVSFLDGDPDRPVIVGALYNGQNLPAFELPAHATRSGIRTQSVGGAGHNELSFEDLAGHEQVRVHAQRDLEEVVRRERRSLVGGDHRAEVQGEARLDVRRGAAVTVTESLALRADAVALHAERDQQLTAGRDLFTRVGRARVDAVEGNAREDIEGDLGTHVEGGYTLSVGKGRDVTVQGDDVEAVWGDRDASVKGDLRERVSGRWDARADGDAALSSRGALTLRARDGITLRCGQSVIEVTRDEVVIRAPKVRVEGGEAVSLEASRASLDLGDGAATLVAAKRAEVASKAVQVRAKDAELALGADGVEAAAKRSITLGGNGATLTLDATATLQGTQVKLTRGGGAGAFRSRVGLPEGSDDVHVLATQLFSPGGVPLAGERVQLIDPQTDEPWGPPLRTDERGELRVEVPHPGPWDLRFVHDDYEEPDTPGDDEVTTELHVLFVDPGGEPLPDLAVNVHGPTPAEARTDEGGTLHLEVAPGAYALEVRGPEMAEARVFHAHATLRADRTQGDGHSYVFVVEADDPDLPEDLREHRASGHGVEAAPDEEGD